MPITVNDGGVLRTHSAEFENVGGVIREKSSVVVNDGGVLHEVFRANKGATVEGITPLVVAEDHIVIVDNGSFTLSAPRGARIIVGGGAQNGDKPYHDRYSLLAGKGGSGGYVSDYILDREIRNAACTLNIGNSVDYGGALTTTTLVIDGVTYDSGAAVQIIQSKWGPIGGNGGQGGVGRNGYFNSGYNGTGAGGGGGYGCYYSATTITPGLGGNYDGYGNAGNSGAGISGGKGGYSAGGGGSGIYRDGTSNNSPHYVSSGGAGGAGIIVIEW